MSIYVDNTKVLRYTYCTARVACASYETHVKHEAALIKP